MLSPVRLIGGLVQFYQDRLLYVDGALAESVPRGVRGITLVEALTVDNPG